MRPDTLFVFRFKFSNNSSRLHRLCRHRFGFHRGRGFRLRQFWLNRFKFFNLNGGNVDYVTRITLILIGNIVLIGSNDNQHKLYPGA